MCRDVQGYEGYIRTCGDILECKGIERVGGLSLELKEFRNGFA